MLPLYDISRVTHTITPQAGSIPQVLVFNGGGVRGVISCRILVALLAQMGGLNVPDVFDLVAGTSTGSIVATALTLKNPQDDSKPLFTAQQVHDLMFNNAAVVFNKSLARDIETGDGLWAPKYTNAGLKQVIGQFGNDTIGNLMTDIWFPTLDTDTYEPFYFTRKKALTDPAWNFPLSEVLLSTTAAPTYFSAHLLQIGNVVHSLEDGGTFANNPSDNAIGEAKSLYGCGLDQRVLCIGTGYKPYNNNPASYQNQGLDKITWLPTAMISAVEKNSINKSIQFLGDKYTYLDLPLNNDSLDNASPENMGYLENAVSAWLEKNTALIEDLAKVYKEKAPGESRHLVREAYS